MAAIKVSLDKLKRLRDKIEKVRAGDFARTVGPAMGAAAVKLVADGFRKQRDPYEKAWLPLRYRKGKILQHTGRLRGSWKFKPKSYGFDIYTNVEYAGAHQFGARIKSRKVKSSIRFKSRRGSKFITRARALKQKRARPILIRAHKIGSFKLPKRMMVPVKKLGPLWAKKLASEGRRAARSYFK